MSSNTWQIEDDLHSDTWQVDLDIEDRWGNTPLQDAVRCNHPRSDDDDDDDDDGDDDDDDDHVHDDSVRCNHIKTLLTRLPRIVAMVKKMMAMKGMPIQSSIKEEAEEGVNVKEGGVKVKDGVINGKESGVTVNGNVNGVAKGPNITVNGGDDGLPDLKVGIPQFISAL